MVTVSIEEARLKCDRLESPLLLGAARSAASLALRRARALTALLKAESSGNRETATKTSLKRRKPLDTVRRSNGLIFGDPLYRDEEDAFSVGVRRACDLEGGRKTSP